MKKWEYYLTIMHTFDSVQLTKELNELGQQGWELSAANFLKDGTYAAFFKREVLSQ